MKPNLIFLIFSSILKLSLVNLTNQDELLSGLEPFCRYNHLASELFCSNFTSLNQLNFNLSNKSYANVLIEVKAGLNLTLDSTLNLDGLTMNSYNCSSSNPKITMTNFNGLDPLWDSFQKIKLLNEPKLLDIEMSNCDWKFANFDCRYYQRENTTNSKFLFSDLNIGLFSLKYPTFYPTSPLCPVIFKRTSINNWLFESLSPIYFKNIDTNENDIAESLGIRVTRLECIFGYGQFVKFLNESSLLNQILFKHLESLVFRQTYIEMIDGKSLENLTKLKSLKFLSYDTRELVNNGVSWMNTLNEGTSLTLEINRFKFDDSDFCYFKDYPQEKLLFLFLSLSRDDFENFLPCTCTIYHVYKNFRLNQNLLANATLDGYYPFHCFSINEILLQEQLDFCQSEYRIEECNSNSTTTPQASVTNMLTINKQCLASEMNCKCSSMNSIKILECTDARITQMPNDFLLDFKLNYASFVGSGVKTLQSNSFKNLKLEENATIILSRIEEFKSDIFLNDTLYTKKVVLVIEKSLLASLIQNFPFRKMNFSRLELNDCQVETDLSIRGFDGAQIDVFSINGASPNSTLLTFKNFFMLEEPVIRKFKLANIFDLFKTISPGQLFGLDSTLINIALFRYIEELEIVNTWLDYIDPEFLGLLSYLKTLRFENVNLKNVIDFTGINNEMSLNWVANENIERIYLGREMYSPGEFNFQNEYACYFSGLSNKTNVYIYDTIDVFDGINCSCTIYWLYNNLDFSNLDKLTDLAYVPLCVKNLNTTNNLNKKLNECFGTTDLKGYCKDLPNTSTTTTTTITSINTTQYSSTSIFENSTNIASIDKKFDYDGFFIVLVAIAGLLGAIVILLAISIFVRCFLKKKFFPIERKYSREEYELGEEKTVKI
jgi:hypothetical protein